MSRSSVITIALAITASAATAAHWEFEQVALSSWAVQTWQRQHPELGTVICYAGTDHKLGIAWFESDWNTQDISLDSFENEKIRSVDIAPDGRIGVAYGAGSDWFYAERTLESPWRISALPVPDWPRGGIEAAFDETGKLHVVYAGSISDTVGLVLHFTPTDDNQWSVDTVARHIAGIGHNNCCLLRLVVHDSERMAVLYDFFWWLGTDTELFYTISLYLATLDYDGLWQSRFINYAYNAGFSQVGLTFGPEDTARFCYYLEDEHYRSFYYGDETIDTISRVEPSLTIDDLGRPIIAYVRPGIRNQPLALMFRDTDWHTVYPGVDSTIGLDLTLDPDGNPLVSYVRNGFVWLTRGVDVLGVEEPTRLAPRFTLRFPTLIRGVLRLSAGHDQFRPGEIGSCPKPALLDISGRKVMDLQPGENDIRHLSPGVYFIRTERVGVRGQETRKVIIQR